VFDVLVLVVRVFRGFQKNNWMLAGLGTGGNGCAIGCNWGINRAFGKFGGQNEKNR
jgi:hypothetical protein